MYIWSNHHVLLELCTLDSGAFSLTQWLSNYCDVNISCDGYSSGQLSSDTEYITWNLRGKNCLSGLDLSSSLSTELNFKWRWGLWNSLDRAEWICLIPIHRQANRQDWSLSRSIIRDDGTVARCIECNNCTIKCSYESKNALMMWSVHISNCIYTHNIYTSFKFLQLHCSYTDIHAFTYTQWVSDIIQ